VGSAPEKRIIRTNYKRQFSDKPSPGRTMWDRFVNSQHSGRFTTSSGKCDLRAHNRASVFSIQSEAPSHPAFYPSETLNPQPYRAGHLRGGGGGRRRIKRRKLRQHKETRRRRRRRGNEGK
jgi:hypothetical protein